MDGLMIVVVDINDPTGGPVAHAVAAAHGVDLSQDERPAAAEDEIETLTMVLPIETVAKVLELPQPAASFYLSTNTPDEGLVFVMIAGAGGVTLLQASLEPVAQGDMN
jgi:hypothetical protein